MYSDVAAERANTLAGQENLVAFARLLVDKPGAVHPAQKQLQEYALRVPFLSELYTVTPDEGKARRLKAQSLRLGKAKEEVDAIIKNRIGEVQFDVLPTPAQVPILEESDE